jgi:hypothetical protein
METLKQAGFIAHVRNLARGLREYRLTFPAHEIETLQFAESRQPGSLVSDSDRGSDRGSVLGLETTTSVDLRRPTGSSTPEAQIEPTDEELRVLALNKAQTRRGVRSVEALAATIFAEDRDLLIGEWRQGRQERAQLERRAATENCPLCDRAGWLLAADEAPLEPTVRCDHQSPPSRPFGWLSAPIKASTHGTR